MATETTKYTVLQKDGKIELREYSSYLVATVQVKSSSHNEAGSKSFSTLADYIFGNNIDTTKINMTVPVTSKKKNSSTKIAMTAPVTITATDDLYAVSFTMPSEYTINTIPQPVNDNIKLHEVKQHKAVAITFSGSTNEDNIRKNTQKLFDWIKENELRQNGSPQIAKYDRPTKPSLLRRNEIIIQLQDK